MSQPTSKTGTYVVTCTTPPGEIASKLGQLIVEAKLAACVNILPAMQSIFYWQGKLEQETEQMLVFETTDTKFRQLCDTLKQNHPYDCPKIVALPIQAGLQDYLTWIKEALTD